MSIEINEDNHYLYTIHTTLFWYSEKDAIDYAKKKGKMHEACGFPHLNVYWAVIKGDPEDLYSPEECYAVTNKYDPMVIAAEKYRENLNKLEK